MNRACRNAALTIAASFSLLACDGLKSTASPDVPLWANHPGAALDLVAQRQLTARSRQKGEKYERGKPAIDSSHRRIFVGSSDHGLYALNAVDLSTLWRFETGRGVQGEPLYDQTEDVVYFGSNDGALYKLRAADGKMLWRFASNAEITRKPVLVGDSVLAMNANDTLISIERSSGTLRWYRHRQPAAGMEISGYAGVAVQGQRAYTAFSDGTVMAYRVQDGAEAWPGPVDLAADAAQAVDGEELRYLDVDTTPVFGQIDGHTHALFVASYEGGVYALDTQSGSRLWANDGVIGATELTLWQGPARPRPDQPASRHRVLVAASGLTGLWGLNLADGSALWRRDLPTGGVTAAEPWHGALLIGTTRYGLFLVHPLDGGILDGIHGGGTFAATPAAYGRRAFVLSNDGSLFALALRPPR